ncbi:MAG: RecQ family ATP-dependent DNA helicase [Planctomycetaceae bacterium]|nr:RecQ family ATP-dependent DNA helicase [Planctomycetaceae bacterium]MBV8556024.1 RecQ family ATP-dependent DNA helicase [Planctomycetaceae bacterium]MBV8676094.1 RecQ family ATP-dependent DNA helicase [Planctomycetaceae bacterium]
MSVTDRALDLEQTLRDHFGLERFRPGQREVIEHVLQARDVLCVMPTGGGKSLCYQLPALLLPGLTLVVSPLIALMKDQVDALTQRGIRATLLNSTLDPGEQRARIQEIEAGRYDLVYVAPERFRSPRFVEVMARLKPALLAVDEAHCISEWGHDFRPDYAKIGHARRRLGSPPCIALTATATDLVRRDIADQLDLRDPAQFVTGFDRPNLSYAVVEARRDADKLAALAQVFARNPGPAIIYASSRARCESVGQFLERELRRSVVVYHAGLTREERTAAQERFMSGAAEVVVATNAFGMGVDKADIRSVIHFNMPGTLEAYYQEAGRAGRDGHPAECVLLFAFGDRKLQEIFIENEYPPAAMVYRVYDFLRAQDADPIEMTQAEVREAAGIELNESAVGTALKILESAGAIEKFLPRENMAIVRINAEPDEISLVPRLSPQAHIQRIVLLGLEGLVNRRHGEPIYFHPDELAGALGLDRPALNRALRALVAELPIDYIPPFRGNAVRVIDRKRRARDLGIDFATLEKRKQREYDKLDQMIKFARARQCRRSFLLGYFGDSGAAGLNCGRCDNCGPAVEGPAALPGATIDTAAGREVILKVLSGVARSKGRVGKTVIAQMLTGSGSEKVDRLGLKRLSTFGILADFRQQEVVQLLDVLERAGLLASEEVGRFRPVVNLSERGWDLVRTKGPFDFTLALPGDLLAKVRNGGLERLASRPADEPRPAPGPRAPAEARGYVSADGAERPEPVPIEHDPLCEHLKALRAEWAREARQPAYCIFANETLEALVRVRPRTPQELAGIKGLGPARLERYGAALLEAISQAGDPPSASIARPQPSAIPSAGSRVPADGPSDRPRLPTAPLAGSYVPTEEWTWRLLDRGFTLDEAAAIRGLDRSAVLRHVALMVRQGRPIAVETFLTPDLIRRWDAWRAEHGDAPPPFDRGASADLWTLFLACRTAR